MSLFCIIMNVLVRKKTANPDKRKFYLEIFMLAFENMYICTFQGGIQICYFLRKFKRFIPQKQGNFFPHHENNRIFFSLEYIFLFKENVLMPSIIFSKDGEEGEHNVSFQHNWASLLFYFSKIMAVLKNCLLYLLIFIYLFIFLFIVVSELETSD